MNPEDAGALPVPASPSQRHFMPDETEPRPPVPVPAPAPRRSRLRIQHSLSRGLRVHVFVFAVVAVDLLVLNLITNRDTIWAVWPIGVWTVLVAAHLGAHLVKPGFFGVHLLGGAAICAGLGIINIFHGRDDASAGGWWVIWPTLAWFVSLVIHLPFAFDLTAAIRPARPSPSTVASTHDR